MNKRSHIIPIIIYLGGLGALLGSDLIVTKYMSDHNVATWAEIRSLIGIASVLCLVGLDQVFVRSPNAARLLLKVLAIQIPLIAMAVAAISYTVGINENWISVATLCAGSAGSLALFQLYRSNGQKTASQFAQQGWKFIALLAMIALLTLDLDVEITTAVAVAVVVTFLASALRLIFSKKKLPKSSESLASIYRIGTRFLVTSLLLSLAIYAEQLVVGKFGSSQDAANYFTHSTYFLFPISVVNGYLAFNISPWIRGHRQKFINLLKFKAGFLLAAIIFYSLVVHLVGWVGWQVLAPGAGISDVRLQLLFLASCVFRSIYMAPSGYLGVFGSPLQHDQLIRLQLIALIAAVSFFVLLFFVFSLSILHATAGASVLNWALRTVAGFVIIGRIEKSLGVN